MNKRTTGYEGFDEKSILEIVVENKKLIAQLTKSTNELLQELNSRKAKYCPACGKQAGEVDFYKSNKRKDGLQVYCKECLRTKCGDSARILTYIADASAKPDSCISETSRNLAFEKLDEYTAS